MQRTMRALCAVALVAGGLAVTATPALANNDCTTAYPMGPGTEMGTRSVNETVGVLMNTDIDWWEHRTALVGRTITLTAPTGGAATMTVYSGATCATVECATAQTPATCTSATLPAGLLRIKVAYSPLGGTGATGYNLTATGMTPTECNDGGDNDGDTWVDGMDPHCTGPSDNTEAQVVVAAYGHIKITADGVNPPTYLTTGVFNDPLKFHCDMDYSPFVQVVCTEIFNTEIAHECSAFILTAQAPAPGGTGTGNVSGYVGCATGSVKTNDVNGAGAEQNSAGAATLGLADPVVCRALGVNGANLPSGTYEVDCYEPGVAWPYGKRPL